MHGLHPDHRRTKQYYEMFPFFVHLPSLCSGVAILRANNQMNKKSKSAKKINRYVIISFGQVFHGNFGGNDSSRDITALGDPANILSRIDKLTKKERIKECLSHNQLILSSLVAKTAVTFFPELEIDRIDLKELKVGIDDFPEEIEIGLLELTKSNLRILNFEQEYLDVRKVA